MAAGTARAGEGLSLVTLITAALASAAAAVLVSQFSESGSAMAAALTAIFVPLLREAFHRPAQKLTEAPRRFRTAATGAGAGAGAVTTRATLRHEGSGALAAAPDAETRRPGDEAPTEAAAGGEARTEVAEPRTNFLGEAGGAPADMLDPGTARTAGAGGTATRALDEGAGAHEAPTRPLGGDDETRPLGGRPDPETRPLGGGDGTPTRRPGPEAPGAGARASNGGAGARRAVGAGAVRRTFGRRPRWRIAIVTGVLAFVIGALVLTVPELIAGGSIGGGEGRTTLFSGGDSTDSGGDDAIEDGTIDGDGSSSDPDEGDGSSDPVPGGGGASEGDAGAGAGGGADDPGGASGDSGEGAPAGGGEDGGRSSVAPEAPSGGDSGSAAPSP